MGCLSIGLRAVIALVTVSTLTAQSTFYWDTDVAPNSATTGTTAPGNWNTTDTNWTMSPGGADFSDVAWVNDGVTPNNAVFSTGSDATGTFTVTLTEGIRAQNLTFQEGTVTVARTGSFVLTLGSTTGTTVPVVSVASGRTATISAPIAGNDGLEKVGAGTLTLSGTNTYTGTTTVTAGTLATSGANRIADNQTLFVAGAATFRLGGNETVGALAGAGSVVLGNRTLTTSSAAASTFGGVISGTGSLTKRGTGIFTLSGANTYSGTTSVAQGTLQTLGDERLGDATAVSVSSGATLSLGGIETIGSLAGAGTVQSNSELIIGGTRATTFTGTFTGSGWVSKRGASGTLTLNATNNSTGGTRVEAGTLVVAKSTALGAASSRTRIVGTDAASLRFNNGITVVNAVEYSNTNSASDVRTGVAAGAAFRTGTSGTFGSSFAGGTDDVEAAFLGGSASVGTTLVMKFAPSLPTAPFNDAARSSDIFSLTGTGTNLFVLRLKVAALNTNSRLGWLDVGSNRWVNAVDGNVGGTSRLFANQAYNPLTMFQLGNYGYDLTTNSVWAVLNHNSQFAVIPEPGVLGLIALGGLVVALRCRRRS